MRVLVTGGAGYIGSIATRTLADSGYEVVVLDTLERGYAEAVDPRARLVVGSVADQAAVGTALEGCSAVLHFAGYTLVEESQRDPELYRRNNADGPRTLLEQMREREVRNFVFSSTAAVYGEPKAVPILENATTEPVNAYGASKLAFERFLEEFESQGLVRAVRFRYFNVAGAWPDGSVGEAHEPETHIIPRILQAMREGQETFEVFGGDYPTPDGTCVRDYVHVVDLVHAHIRGLALLESGGASGVYNLGSGTGYSNLEVVSACAKSTGRDVEVVVGPRRSGDPAVLVASNTKAADVLGWEPRRDLAVMVEDAWRWHIAHPNGYR